MKLLTILDPRLRGNDMFFQSVPSLSVIPAKAGIQELIDNLSIVDNQNNFPILFELYEYLSYIIKSDCFVVSF